MTRVGPVYYTRHFFLTLLINAVITVLINGIIDYFSNKGHALALVGSATMINVCIFCFIMSFLSFAGSGDIHKRIRKGMVSPVTADALRDNKFKRWYLFPIAHASWKKRLPLWILWCVVFLGVPIFFCVFLFCWASRGFAPMHGEECKTGSLWVYVAWTETWKCVTVSVMHTVNYAAAHNDEQSELDKLDDEETPILDSDADKAGASESVEVGDIYDDAVN